MNDSMPQEHWRSITQQDKYWAVEESIISRKETETYPAIRAKEYVLSLFPQFAEAVDCVKMYKNENTAFCAKIGCSSGVGGCYFVKENFILICWNPLVEYELVACHELLHYVSRLCGSSVSSVEQEEDFAFSKSIRFALGIGKDLTWVRDVYMRPFYMHWADRLFSATVVNKDVAHHVMGSTTKKLAHDHAFQKMMTLIAKEIGPGAFSMPPKPSRPLKKYKPPIEEDEDAPLSYL